MARRLTVYGLRLLRALPPLALFLLTGLALAAIQFIPAIEYTCSPSAPPALTIKCPAASPSSI
jgi:hypothetical protein